MGLIICFAAFTVSVSWVNEGVFAFSSAPNLLVVTICWRRTSSSGHKKRNVSFCSPSSKLLGCKPKIQYTQYHHYSIPAEHHNQNCGQLFSFQYPVKVSQSSLVIYNPKRFVMRSVQRFFQRNKHSFLNNRCRLQHKLK